MGLLLLTFACSKTPGPETPSNGEAPNSDDASTPPSDEDAVPPNPGETTAQDEGADCGGMTGLSCKEGFFCLYAIGDTCGAADQMGKCTRIPEACTMDYSPVCGCDDKTHSNACAAYSKGISVASDGECAAP